LKAHGKGGGGGQNGWDERKRSAINDKIYDPRLSGWGGKRNSNCFNTLKGSGDIWSNSDGRFRAGTGKKKKEIQIGGVGPAEGAAEEKTK